MEFSDDLIVGLSLGWKLGEVLILKIGIVDIVNVGLDVDSFLLGLILDETLEFRDVIAVRP